MLDNTWATPLGFRAFDHGVDVSVHAATKYIGGHSDVLLGVIVANAGDVSGAASPVDRHGRHRVDATIASSACAACARSRVRLRAACRRARCEIAQWLRARPEVAEVLYPALPGARGHELWKRDFRGASGLFGVVLKPVAQRAHRSRCSTACELFGMGWSWGGFESLIIPTYPERARTRHALERRAGRACACTSGSRIRTT